MTQSIDDYLMRSIIPRNSHVEAAYTQDELSMILFKMSSKRISSFLPKDRCRTLALGRQLAQKSFCFELKAFKGRAKAVSGQTAEITKTYQENLLQARNTIQILEEQIGKTFFKS